MKTLALALLVAAGCGPTGTVTDAWSEKHCGSRYSAVCSYSHIRTIHPTNGPDVQVGVWDATTCPTGSNYPDCED